ncbi:coiled-coil domain-containing protein 115 [Eublepharis macularius]|uniref:Vacuolar ATPase assembly protein VMA22 n=1 Tax=Eublepharis macularius TaxID=481883 RepID=A0AA97KR85_EUBMA|nr:coiled-coil domain-containing protein 115 [Eublepharis macularius]XP_054859613.1 coiled-coil domain-containing protein 115 [Eublepharis macularius]XP_054859614.1 coiled-coil domain-containing protein 115 [Eublepharis macularius]
MAPAEDRGPTEICEELDQTILHLFDVLELLQTKRESFNSLVEQGWFSLSKSRYAMGNKCVSALQYGHQMKPLVRVDTRKKEEGQVEFHVVSEGADTSKPKVEKTATVEEIGPSDQVLRRRKGTGKTDAPIQPEEEISQPAEKSGKQDPLTWFGILVPQSLRQAQKTFQEGIRLTAEIASLQSEVETTRRRYRALLEEKRQISAKENVPEQL